MAGMKSVEEEFRRMDKDGSGSLGRRDIEAGLAERQLPRSRAVVEAFFSHADADGDGRVTMCEFRHFCAERERQLREVYDGMDKSGSGKLTSDDLKRGAQELGVKISSEQLRLLHRRADESEKHGVISFADFRSFLLLLPEVNPPAVFEAFSTTVLVDHAQSECTPPPELGPYRERHTAPHLGSTAAAASSGSSSSSSLGPLSLPLAALPLAPFAALSNLLFPSSEDYDDSRASALASKLYSGCVAGAVSRTVTAPIDRTKMLMQVSSTKSPVRVRDAVQAILSEGGVSAFFRGNSVNVLKIAPETSIKFVAFDQCKTVLADDPGNCTVGERLVAGSAAGALAQAVIYPLEICKTRLAVSAPGIYSGIVHCLRTVVRKEGSAALYQGLGTSIVGIMPYAGIDLTVNSLLKDCVGGFYAEKAQEPGVPAVLACGMLSSTCAMLLTYPLNLVRTRLQASGMPGSTRFLGPIDCVRQTWAGGGLKAFYRGLGPNMLKVLPATSISYAVFDTLSGG